jgi:hypothetical protein
MPGRTTAGAQSSSRTRASSRSRTAACRAGITANGGPGYVEADTAEDHGSTGGPVLSPDGQAVAISETIGEHHVEGEHVTVTTAAELTDGSQADTANGAAPRSFWDGGVRAVGGSSTVQSRPGV